MSADPERTDEDGVRAEESAEETRADEGARTEEPDGEDAGTPGRLARIGTGLAWLVGVVLIGVGLLGMAGRGSPGLPYLVLGLLVTPRTRRELKELCRILSG